MSQGISLFLLLAVALPGVTGKAMASGNDQSAPQQVAMNTGTAAPVQAASGNNQAAPQQGSAVMTVADAAAATPAATPAATAAAPASLQGFMNYADFTWVNGNTHETDFPMAMKVFSPEILLDTNYAYDFARPNDHVISGSTCTNLGDQVVLEHFGFGGDFNVDNVHARLMTEFGMYATEVPRDDETPARGSWNVITGTQYLTEAYGGYHFNIPGTDGLNVEMGQFPSYVGLYSFYDSENWTYQASYVSSNTPWFFTGMRVQFFPNDTLKIEPWLINGWQTYNMFDEGLGNSGLNYGAEIRWAPNPGLVVISNNYAGPDNADSPDCIKYHTDDSVVAKYLDDPKSNGIDKMAFSITADAGMQSGPLYVGPNAAVYDSENTVYGSGNGTNYGASYGPINAPAYTVGPSGYVTVGPGNKYVNGVQTQYAEYFLGIMGYDRTWFAHDTIAFTFGGGWMTNPGRYLGLLPPIDGDTGANYNSDPVATAAFDEAPGLPWSCWDYDISLQVMTNEYLTWDLEYTHRVSSINYFVGPGGVTSSDGWTTGAATGSIPVNGGAANGYYTSYHPDLVKDEDIIVGAIMVHI